jgi:hypothetical protein
MPKSAACNTQPVHVHGLADDGFDAKIHGVFAGPSSQGITQYQHKVYDTPTAPEAEMPVLSSVIQLPCGIKRAAGALLLQLFGLHAASGSVRHCPIYRNGSQRHAHCTAHIESMLTMGCGPSMCSFVSAVSEISDATASAVNSSCAVSWRRLVRERKQACMYACEACMVTGYQSHHITPVQQVDMQAALVTVRKRQTCLQIKRCRKHTDIACCSACSMT